MRRFTLLLLGMVVTLCAFAQAQRMAPPSAAIPQEARPLYFDESARPADPVVSPYSVGTQLSATVTAFKIGEGANAFGSLSPGTNQITHITSLGFMAAIYRNNSGVCGGESGHYRYSYSTDLGVTWDIAAGGPGACFGYGFMNPNFQQACRYPNLIAHLPKTQNSIDSVDLIYSGWHHDGVNGNPFTAWTGSIVGTVDDATAFTSSAVNVVQESYPMTTEGDEGSTNMSLRVEGEYWIPSPITTSTNPSDNGKVNLWKGLYNEASGAVDWSVAATLSPNHIGPSDPTIVTPVIGFGPNGQNGIVAWLGDVVSPLNVPGADSTLSIVYSETSDGGATWGPVEEVPLISFPNLRDSIESFWTTTLDNGDTVPASGGVPTTGFDLDLVVDANGNPHIITLIGSGNNRLADGTTSALGDYTIFSGLRKFMYDFTRDASGNWNGIYLGAPATFRGEFTGISVDNYVQASRSEDGNYVFLSWTDTDTTNNFGSADNLNPDLLGRAYDVQGDLISAEINFTDGDANWDGLALMPTIDPIALFDGTCVYTTPTMVSEFTDGASTTGYWYFSNISYDACTDITLTPNFLSNCGTSTIASTLNTTEPACGASDGSLGISVTGGVMPFTYSWSTGGAGTSIDGLAPGFYSVIVTDADGCITEQEFLLESDGAATAAPTLISDISCTGFDDGSATAVMTGGTAPFTFEWGNGETDSIADDLEPGITTVTITDANGCVTFSEVSITEPPALVIDPTTGISNGVVTCFGDTNGSVSATATGGTGTLSYSWDVNSSIDQTVNDLGAGIYTVTVTDDNNCEVTATAEVTSPPELAPTTQTSPVDLFPSSIGVLYSNGNVGNGPPYTYVIDLLSVDGVAAPTGVGLDTVITDNDPNDFALSGPCAGTYLLEITDALGCTFSDTVTVGVGTTAPDPDNAKCFEPDTTPISIQPLLGLRTFAYFPNPTTGELSVELELVQLDDVRLEVINTRGQVIAAHAASQVPNFKAAFDLSKQARGIYLLRVTTSQGVHTAKVLVQP